MNWEQFFEEYCTLSDEHNTPKGTIKEYSTKGRNLNIHWTYKSRISGLEFGELKEIRFIQHSRVSGNERLHPIPVIHEIECYDRTGTEHYVEMEGDDVYNSFQIQSVEIVDEYTKKEATNEMNDDLHWVALCVSLVCIIVNVMQNKWYEGMLFLVIALLQVCNIQKGMGK